MAPPKRKKSSKMKINLADIPSNNIPEGEYEATIEQIEVKESKAGDSYYLNWTFLVTDAEYIGRKVWMITSLKPAALWNLKSQLEALGIDGSAELDLDWDDSSSMLTEPDLVGINCFISISHDEYQGQVRPKVSHIISSELVWDDEEDEEEDDEGVGSEPLDDDALI